ncbi:MAG TPA: diphthine--ammonia ligase [Bacteroidota bacterium]|nr:diphthine--ammonia ligase [Bacteroidota bacterium]
MPVEKAVFHWSGGKDSALALHKVLSNKDIAVSTLLTSVNEQYRRISMHGVRAELLERQAESIGIPLVKMMMPEMPDMKMYEAIMKETLVRLRGAGMTASIFGDIFLEDLRKYREDNLAAMNIKPMFPLWKVPTDRLVREFIELGFKAVVVCANDKYLDQEFVGRTIDGTFLADLPRNVDPCGENGEFHSFVYDGPIFTSPVAFEFGEVVHRKYRPVRDGLNSPDDCFTSPQPFDGGFWYCDLKPVKS